MAGTETEKRNVGRIEEIQGVVIEAVFPEELPEIYSALLIERASRGEDGISAPTWSARSSSISATTACGRWRWTATDGLARGAEVIDTGGPIRVPVGRETLGRIFNLLGETIDVGKPSSSPRSAGRSTVPPRPSSS